MTLVKINKQKSVIHNLADFRKPLFGFWDMGSQYQGIINKYQGEDSNWNPNNNEIQASELIDLPTLLKRNMAISHETTDDKRYRYQEPYSDIYKNRLYNAYLFDPVINQAITIRCAHILGKGMRTVLEPDPYIALGDDRNSNEILADIITVDKQNGLMEYIKKVEKITGIYTKYKRLCYDYFVGGRSAEYMLPANADTIEKYDLKPGTPAFLIDLEWRRLGQVKLDKNDNIDKVEYRDELRFPPTDNRAKDEQSYATFLNYNPDAKGRSLIYLTRNERYYGRSIIQTILSTSEQNRMMNEQDLPEITKARWAASYLFWSDKMSMEELEDFIADRSPAKDSAVRNEIHAQLLQTDANPSPLTELRQANARFMLMQLDVPSFMMKMEEITNRATSVSVLSTWRNLTLEDDRETFRQLMWDQFYKKLVILYFQDEADFDIIKADFRVGFLFQNLSVTDDESEAKVVDILQKHGIETPTESRRRMNLSPAIEIDAMDKVLANNQNAREVGQTKEGIQDLVGGSKEQVIKMMRDKGLPSDLIASAEEYMNGRNA